MRVIGIPSSLGALGKNDGTAQAPGSVLGSRYEKVAITGDVEKDSMAIEQAGGKGVVAVGGDHSLTYSLVKGAVQEMGRLQLIILDAHADMMEDFTPPTHEAFVRALVTEGIVQAEDIVVAGIRTLDPQEELFIAEQGITCLSVEELRKQGLRKKGLPVYVSVDIDVVDPSEAPGTGYPVPGGLNAEEVVEAVKALKPHAGDVVEIDPSRDVGGRTVLVGKRIVEAFGGDV